MSCAFEHPLGLVVQGGLFGVRRLVRSRVEVIREPQWGGTKCRRSRGGTTWGTEIIPLPLSRVRTRLCVCDGWTAVFTREQDPGGETLHDPAQSLSCSQRPVTRRDGLLTQQLQRLTTGTRGLKNASMTSKRVKKYNHVRIRVQKSTHPNNIFWQIKHWRKTRSYLCLENIFLGTGNL